MCVREVEREQKRVRQAGWEMDREDRWEDEKKKGAGGTRKLAERDIPSYNIPARFV